MRRRHGESRLADPARPDERHDRRVGERVADDREITLAADQASQPTGEIPATADVGPQGRMLTVAELEDPLLGDHALEAERPEVTQTAVVQQCDRHRRDQRLAAVTGGGKPGGDDDRRAEVALPSLLGLTSVQTDANPELDLTGPWFAADRGL